MYQKGVVQPVYAPRSSVIAYRPGFDSNEHNETEFEDESDLEEYSGRRSEDSVRRFPIARGRRFDTNHSVMITVWETK